MTKLWKVEAELNMDASHHDYVIVEANTERKALKKAEEQFKREGNFVVSQLRAVRI